MGPLAALLFFANSLFYFTENDLKNLSKFGIEKKYIEVKNDTVKIALDSSVAITKDHNLFGLTFNVGEQPFLVIPKTKRQKRQRSLTIDEIWYDGDGTYIAFLTFRAASLDAATMMFNFNEAGLNILKCNRAYHVDDYYDPDIND